MHPSHSNFYQPPLPISSQQYDMCDQNPPYSEERHRDSHGVQSDFEFAALPFNDYLVQQPAPGPQDDYLQQPAPQAALGQVPDFQPPQPAPQPRPHLTQIVCCIVFQSHLLINEVAECLLGPRRGCLGKLFQ